MSLDSGFVPAESVTIRDQLSVVARRWRVILLVTVLGLVAGTVYSLHRGTQFTSNAVVAVNAPVEDQFVKTSGVPSTVIMPNEQKLAGGTVVAAAAAKILKSTKSPSALRSQLVVTVPASSQLLNFAFSAATASNAEAGAAAFAKAYINERVQSVQAAKAQTLLGPETSLKQYRRERGALQARLARAKAGSAASNNIQGQITALNSEIGQATSQISLVQSVDPTSAATLQQPATTPLATSSTHKIILVGTGLIGGLVLGLLLGFLIDSLDDHLHGPADLAAAIGAPVLARVPVVRRLPWRPVDLSADGTSHPKVAEAYRLLANRLLVHASSQQLGSIMIASPSRGEGRSSVSANLAATLVSLGCRVWLVSADLLPPQVHRLFAPNEDDADLISVVPMAKPGQQGAPAKEMTLHSESGEIGQGHLTLVSTMDRRPTGRLLNPLLLVQQVRENQAMVDLTIIDAPALLDFADAVPLLPVVDGVLIVADAGATRRGELSELMELLDGTQSIVIGGVLNRDGSRIVSKRARRARKRVERGDKMSRESEAETKQASQSTDRTPTEPVVVPSTASAAPETYDLFADASQPAAQGANVTVHTPPAPVFDDVRAEPVPDDATADAETVARHVADPVQAPEDVVDGEVDPDAEPSRSPLPPDPFVAARKTSSNGNGSRPSPYLEPATSADRSTVEESAPDAAAGLGWPG